MTAHAVHPGSDPDTPDIAEDDDVAELILRLQSEGLRSAPPPKVAGGAGPSDVGMLWVEPPPPPPPTSPSPPTPPPRSSCEVDDDGAAIYEDGRRVAAARTQSRPRYYDLTTADGIPYWKIALLHLDSLASTVLQTCAYWGNDDQCAFCGIGVILEAGRTIAEEDAGAARRGGRGGRDLDGAVDVTLTTGSTARPTGRCTSPSAPGGEGGQRPAGGDAVRAARRPRRDRPGGRPGRRHGGHPRRDVRSRGAGAGGAGQGPHGHRRLLRGLGAGGAAFGPEGRSPRT